jgi:hypothetical protein
MKIANKYCLVVLALVFTAFTLKPAVKSIKVIVSEESSLIINGQSNVNKFQCHYDISQLNDSIGVKYSLNGEYLRFTRAKLKLENLNFDCGHKAINKDFNRLLNSSVFPNIIIDLISAEVRVKDSELETTLDITISNITKSYTLPVQISKRKTDFLVCGKLPIDINDFNLEPPKKMLGIIKVSNEIEIDFSLAVITNSN